MRERYCRYCEGWHDVSEPLPHNCAPERNLARSSLSSPYFVSDGIEIQSMHDGQMYTSKSKLRSEYRAHGVEEIGNEPIRTPEAPKTDRKKLRQDLKDAYQSLKGV
jgi:hypothetical protein